MYISLIHTSPNKDLDQTLKTWLQHQASGMNINDVTLAQPSYQATLAHYETIAQSDLLIVWNVAELDTTTIFNIMFAMLKQRPILLLLPPTFAKNVDLFSKITIENRLSKLILSDISYLDKKDLQSILANIAVRPVNYVLTKREVILIRSRLRAYFRELLDALREH